MPFQDDPRAERTQELEMMYLLIITCVGCGDISASPVPYKIATYTDLKSCEEAGAFVREVTHDQTNSDHL
jgi:hypothetical protein